MQGQMYEHAFICETFKVNILPALNVKGRQHFIVT